MVAVYLRLFVVIFTKYTVIQVGSTACAKAIIHFFDPSHYTIGVWRSARVAGRLRAGHAAASVRRVRRHQDPQGPGTDLHRRVLHNICGTHETDQVVRQYLWSFQVDIFAKSELRTRTNVDLVERVVTSDAYRPIRPEIPVTCGK